VLSKAGESFEKALPGLMKAAKGDPKTPVNGHCIRQRGDRSDHQLYDTSNPSVLIAAGLLAKKLSNAARMPAFVKTSLAPGSKVVLDYLQKAACAVLEG